MLIPATSRRQRRRAFAQTSNQIGVSRTRHPYRTIYSFAAGQECVGALIFDRCHHAASPQLRMFNPAGRLRRRLSARGSEPARADRDHVRLVRRYACQLRRSRGQSRIVTNQIPRPSRKPDAQTMELINAEIAASLARQSDSGARIDTKAIVVVGYAAAAASFLVTRLAQPVLAGLAYASYAAAASFGIWSYAVRSYEDVPTPRNLFGAYWERDRVDVLAALAAARVPAFENNAAKHDRKARLWLLSLLTLLTGVILMLCSLAFGAHTLAHDRPAGPGQATAATGR